ncbi:Lacal_2735 family protein [Aureibaculum marinum]|uniref:Lacal_2735 family protein n=1 Tax=Aureibaculum marinum TaxID=2487930 RepID=A0A3N4N6E6_9FLAO|nr:Lacal_2735 family protein [Aureibaculum marinum]RPD90748.1 Lacal_2735 family protein [Aureibaculum marinum]
MFNLFKKKSEIEKLNDKYKKLLEESHKLSTTNRKESDSKYAEADEILRKIETLNKN